jgi:hypothetical protein
VPRPHWTCTVSDAPRKAPADHAALPACEEVHRDLWRGSDIPATKLRTVPERYVAEALACGACGSADTRCLHLFSNTGVAWAVMETEVVCRACGRYTLWNGED